MTEPKSWDDLNNRDTPAAKPDNEFDVVCAQVFASAPGQRLLAALRKKHFDSVANPLAEERALRVRIANQQFVRDLELATERGLAAASAKK